MRWFRGPLGRELSRLTGASHGEGEVVDEATGSLPAADLGEDDTRLLWLLIEAKTNREIAAELEVDEEIVARRLAEMYATDRGLLARRGCGPRLQGRDGVSMLRARVDRHRCIGAGNCITVAPTAFDWLKGDLGKADVIDPDSVEAELLREAALSCPTDAIVIEEVEALLPWQLRGKAGPDRRVLKTFMFTDIVKSTNLAEAMGDDAWLELLRWHDETLRSYFAAHTTARRWARPATVSSSDSTAPTRRSRVPSQSSADLPTTASSTALRRRCGSVCTHRAPRKSTEASAAREFTRRRGSQPWPKVGRSSQASPRSAPLRSTR